MCQTKGNTLEFADWRCYRAEDRGWEAGYSVLASPGYAIG